eukprot:scaffold978_cov172-Ochromonas_danica.AAC.5
MSSNAEKELRHTVEFIPDRLYYVALSGPPPSHPQRHFFSIDKEMVYWNFYLDFGPLNLGHLYRFCALLNNKLGENKLKDKVIFFYSHTHPHKRANAAFLICSWALLYQNKSPEDAYKPFKNYPAPFPPWHDATPSICTFTLTILDTLRGLAKAREHRFFDFTRFNIEEYEHYEQVENGDLNWYAEGRFLGFAGPHAERECSPGGYYTLRPEDYIPYFKRKNVSLVVRLNKSYYDPKRFTSQGIDHVDMYFLDGSNPPEHILQKFIQKCEETTGGIGLGRTGTCIACYVMKHYRFTAEEIIGWMRIARPGSVIGPQQHFLKEVQNRMWREGELYRQRFQSLSLPAVPAAKDESSTSTHTAINGSGSILSRHGTAQGSPRVSSGGGVGIADHTTTSSVPSTPPLNGSLSSRMSRLTVTTPPPGSASGSRLTSSSGSGKLMASSTKSPATSIPPAGKAPSSPQSPGFFDLRPSSSSSSSPRTSVALSSYFRTATSVTARTPPASSSGTRATSTSTSATVSMEVREEEEGGATQGDFLRQRRQQHAGSGSSTPLTPTSPPDAASGARRSNGRSSFSFLSSWK